MFEFLAAFIFTLIAFLTVKYFGSKRPNDKHACIIVLGDIGRSPRMNYHCISLINIGYTLTFIGYKESALMEQMDNNPQVKILALKPYPKLFQIGPGILQYVLKTIFLTITLLIKLIEMKSIPMFILVQNPPSIPTLGLAFVYSRLVKSKFIIDWHNYGYTILAIKSGYDNIVVKICKKFEIFFGQRSDLNFCVTQAMSKDLEKYKIKSRVLYDKPHERFKELNLTEKEDFYSKLNDKYKIQVPRRLDRLNFALLVSSSSWTEDEDFHILIDALKIYQSKLDQQVKQLPNLIILLTGKGPLKDYYKHKFEQLDLKSIKVHFVWLDQEDYPLLLGSCDLGICLHMSSSNLDLPMKVVDMFGARLPACAYSFDCISELVKEEENGVLFKNSEELSNRLIELLESPSSKLDKFRKNLKDYPNWNQEWKLKVETQLNLLKV